MHRIAQRIRQALLSDIPLQRSGKVFYIESTSEEPEDIVFRFTPRKIIFPVREGELVEDPGRIPVGKNYTLSYPGTASTKCVALFGSDFDLFIGGKPSLEYTRITLQRVDAATYQLRFTSKEHAYYLIPFQNAWEKAAEKYRGLIGSLASSPREQKPRFMLQLGVKDSFGKVHVRHFNELVPVVYAFHQYFGPGHIVHFFGTNRDGFDRMFPDYTIDPGLGGEDALAELIRCAKSLGLMTSHHYNPRIADVDWMARFPEYRSAIVRKDGRAVVEPYKEHPHYVMNPNDDRWFARCFETVDYLCGLGLDYLEIDQFTYQRNFYEPNRPIAEGYRKMLDEFIRRGIRFWLEGVSDVFRLPSGNFYQILIRDKAQLWEDDENRRGYPYGRTFAKFFMTLFPDSEVSYQVLTEHKLFDRVAERLRAAKENNAAVYDIELGFYDERYMGNLEKMADILRRHGAI